MPLTPPLPRKPTSSRPTPSLPQLLTTATTLLLLCLSYAPPPTLADCECGYLATINPASNTKTAIDSNNNHRHTELFTDLLETDFTRFGLVENGKNNNDGLAGNPDWAPQAFNLTRERARGEYGEMFAVENVRLVTGADDHDGDDDDQGGKGGGDEKRGDKGLELVVRSELVDGMVPVAELATRRLDLMWGTFRTGMKVSGVRGTCAAFFWYFNDTQEIDMEFLSKDFDASSSSYPVNLVLQSREAAMAGYDAAKTGNFAQVNLPFDPTDGFHEYRIDYLPGRVFFYVDGVVLAEMDGPAVPSSPGHLILQHWSNGNKHWSGGPPAEDAGLVVSYVKAYFNSSTEQRQRDWENRCHDLTAPGAVCRIPDVVPGDASAADWFFGDQGNMTNNQTVSDESKGGRVKGPWWSMVGWLLLVGGWAVAL